MPSIKHLVTHYPVSETRLKFAHNKKTGQYEKIVTTRPVMQQTLAACRTAALHFVEYCNTHYQVGYTDKRGRSKVRRCRYPDECKQYIQAYADYLAAQGKTASTVHTYIARLCHFYSLPLAQYDLPKRHAADYTKGRGGKAVEARRDAQPECSPRLKGLADMVGIRRGEYAQLLGRSYVCDESGCPCVEVLSGKGGKRQLQRILPQYAGAVKEYFAGLEPDEPVFTTEELGNKINLHRCREQVALEHYLYYLERLRNEPAYREQLRRELQARIEADNQYNQKRYQKKGKRWRHRTWDEGEYTGTYYLRGDNRKLAEQIGAPISYDKAALLATSVFALAHYRSDVTIASYILAAYQVKAGGNRPAKPQSDAK